MKTITTLLVTTFCVLFSFVLDAQNNCNETLSLFAGNVKTKRYAEALPQLEYLRKNCATLNYGIYARGEILLKHELKKAADKKTAALELIKLYKDRLKLFPSKTAKGKFLPKIGELMINYKIGSIAEQYKTFDEAFTSDKEHFKHPLYLYRYFELYYKMYTSRNHSISLENLIEKYETVEEKFAFERTRTTKNIAGIDKFSKNMGLLVEKEATCETLIPMYEKKFELNKNNINWMRKAARRLDAKDCKDAALFTELVEAIDAAEPNANSKLYLSKIYEHKGNSLKAKTFLDQYLTLETDGVKKANILNKEGKKAAQKGQKSKARSYYIEATKANPNSGRIYLNIAKLYGSSANACGTDEFTKKAIYWKAAEMARKAAKTDASVKREANDWVERYMTLAPDKTAIFNKGYKGGEKIVMKCWVGGNVTVPNL